MDKISKTIESRKGFSLVNVVVALSLITVVTVLAFTLIFSSIKAEAENICALDVSAAADDVLDCFKYAEDNDNGNMEQSFFALISRLDAYTAETDGSGEEVYVLAKVNYEIIVKIIDRGAKGKELSFNAYKLNDGERGEEIFSYEYVHKKG